MKTKFIGVGFEGLEIYHCTPHVTSKNAIKYQLLRFSYWPIPDHRDQSIKKTFDKTQVWYDYSFNMFRQFSDN